MPVSQLDSVPTSNGEINRYRLWHPDGIDCTFLSLGATLTHLLVPVPGEKPVDVVLGYDNAENYLQDTAYLGAIAGRYCNRIGNGSFSLDGKNYQLSQNEGRHHLHGGHRGFDRKIWQVSLQDEQLIFRLRSPDGEEGFPGTLDVEVIYALSDPMTLSIHYRASSDQDTVINLTQHSYFNLNGKGTIEDHWLKLPATDFVAIDTELIPTGDLVDVKGTPFDFHIGSPIGQRLRNSFLAETQGFDHCLLLEDGLANPVLLRSGETGISLSVFTDQPSVQLYTANQLNPATTGKYGLQYKPYGGVCIETQHLPDSPNHATFPSTRLNRGDVFSSRTSFSFSA